MAAVGILAALRERDGSGEGQLVDVSMADGSLSWLGMVAARYFCDGVTPQRGDPELAGSLVCYRPYECADGWVTLGALEPKFWRNWCHGVGREDLVDRQFERPGSDTHRQVQEIFRSRTRDEWQAFAGEHDCCLEPVLDLDEALSSDLVRARGMVGELDQRSGVSSGTIKHYLREGLLGGREQIVRTSRNMAYYPENFVDRIRLIKRLQEERFLPLRLIKDVLDDDPDRAARLVELEDRVVERALAHRAETGTASSADVAARYDVPENVLARLEDLGVVSSDGYDADDERIVAAISRFRAGGYDEALGFTVYDTLRY